MIALITSIVQFLILMFGEYFSGSARAREENKVFTLSQEKFEEMATKCLSKMRESNRKESSQAQDLEDQLDKNRPKTGGES